jgi:hypothetical protein
MNSFTIYSDAGDGCTPNNYWFNYSSNNPACSGNEYTSIENPALTQGQTIKRFCIVGGTGNNCSDTGLATLNIGFIKPNPEAIIHDSSQTKFAGAIIVVASALGDKCRVVRVSSIGQISVDTPLSDASECTSMRQ